MHRLTRDSFIGGDRSPAHPFRARRRVFFAGEQKSGILHFHGGDCRYFHGIKHQRRRDHQGPDAPKARTILAIEPRQLSLVKDVLPALYLSDPKFAIHSGRKFIDRHWKRDVPYLVDHAMGNLIPRQPDRFGTIAILKLDRSDLYNDTAAFNPADLTLRLSCQVRRFEQERIQPEHSAPYR